MKRHRKVPFLHVTVNLPKMDIFLQQIINGLVQGSIYALVALGYTMVYGIMGLINFAHGEVVMIGALVTITVASLLIKAGVPLAVAGLAGLVAAVLACMALGWGLERVAYRPLRNAPRLTPLITAIGMSIVLQNVAMIVWGRNYMPSRPCCRRSISSWRAPTSRRCR